MIARDAARMLDYVHPEEAYLAGLLHNVGRLALLAAAPKEYAFNFTALDDEDLCAVEQRTLQITHAEAGAWLIERWQLDSFLADAVLYHHEPGDRLVAGEPLEEEQLGTARAAVDTGPGGHREGVDGPGRRLGGGRGAWGHWGGCGAGHRLRRIERGRRVGRLSLLAIGRWLRRRSWGR